MISERCNCKNWIEIPRAETSLLVRINLRFKIEEDCAKAVPFSYFYSTTFAWSVLVCKRDMDTKSGEGRVRGGGGGEFGSNKNFYPSAIPCCKWVEYVFDYTWRCWPNLGKFCPQSVWSEHWKLNQSEVWKVLKGECQCPEEQAKQVFVEILWKDVGIQVDFYITFPQQL